MNCFLISYYFISLITGTIGQEVNGTAVTTSTTGIPGQQVNGTAVITNATDSTKSGTPFVFNTTDIKVNETETTTATTVVHDKAENDATSAVGKLWMCIG